MNPKITIIAIGDKVDESSVQSSLEAVPQLKVKKVGLERGLPPGVIKVVKFVGEFIGNTAQIADALIEQATKQLAGASLKMKFGDMEIEISNANRSQIIDLLNHVANLAKGTDNL